MESELIRALTAIKDSIDAAAQPRTIDWIAIGMSFLSIVVSGVAIWFAARVPKKIADRQDRIALFEKRFQCYTAIQTLIACSNQISSLTTNHEVQIAFRIWLDPQNGIIKNIPFENLLLKLNQMKPILVAGRFLFKEYDDTLLQNIVNSGIILTEQVSSNIGAEATRPLSSKAMDAKAQFCDLCSEFYTRYLDSIEKELDIRKEWSI